jgi:hypothetical protein
MNQVVSTVFIYMLLILGRKFPLEVAAPHLNIILGDVQSFPHYPDDICSHDIKRSVPARLQINVQ